VGLLGELVDALEGEEFTECDFDYFYAVKVHKLRQPILICILLLHLDLPILIVSHIKKYIIAFLNLQKVTCSKRVHESLLAQEIFHFPATLV